jgi:hypothetical protein
MRKSRARKVAARMKKIGIEAFILVISISK